MTDEGLLRLKTEWSKTEYIPYPLPKRLRCGSFRPKLVKPAPFAISDDDVPF